MTMQTPTPISITYGTTPTGSRYAVAQFPVRCALQARHMPHITHKGMTYVPYTGEVVAAYRGNVSVERPEGYYLEYRALRD